jgi:hypothetical protein
MSRFALLFALGLAGTAAAQAIPDHLKCYKVKDPIIPGRYTATLGGLIVESGCVIKLPAQLVCVPATKTNVMPAPPGGGGSGAPGPFACYKVRCPRTALPAVRLDDQFGSRMVQPLTPKLLCAPAVPSTTTTTTLPGCTSTGDCAADPAGTACVEGHCGCTSQGDCPPANGSNPGRSCLLAGIFVCVPDCNKPNVTTCNGGCCSAAINGVCQPGTSDTACGTGGNVCVDCQGSTCVQGGCTP